MREEVFLKPMTRSLSGSSGSPLFSLHSVAPVYLTFENWGCTLNLCQIVPVPTIMPAMNNLIWFLF